MRSPIEMMVDKACGFDANKPEPKKYGFNFVTLICPMCKREKTALRDKTDPNGTATVESPCPDCDQPGTFEDPVYRDKDGKQILPNEQPPK